MKPASQWRTPQEWMAFDAGKAEERARWEARVAKIRDVLENDADDNDVQGLDRALDILAGREG